MKKFTKIATVAVMTMVTAGVFAGCGLKGGKDIGKEAALEAALADAGVRDQIRPVCECLLKATMAGKYMKCGLT